MDAIGWGSGERVTAGVLGGLDENRIGPTQNILEEPAPAAIARQSAIGDAAVCDEERGPGAFRFAIEIGPDFGFEYDDQRWPQTAQNAADRRAVIEGSEEDAIGEAGKLLRRQRVSGEGGGRYKQLYRGPLGTQ